MMEPKYIRRGNTIVKLQVSDDDGNVIEEQETRTFESNNAAKAESRRLQTRLGDGSLIVMEPSKGATKRKRRRLRKGKHREH